MYDEKLERLIDDKIKDIFSDNELLTLSDIDKALRIYQYLSSNVTYNFPLLERKIKKAGRVDPAQEVFNIFEKGTGICSSLSQAYRLLLERVNIKAQAVICDDGNLVLHQLLIIKNNDDNTWFFSDVTRGILYKEEGLDNFSYGLDRCGSINQKMLGILPGGVYDAFLKRKIIREMNLSQLNDHCLFDLPENIINNIRIR